MRAIDTFTTVLLILLIPCTVTSSYGSGKAPDSITVGTLASGEIIPDAELQQVKLDAIRGSKLAARRLVMHFAIGISDMKQATYWAQIGAENGDPVCENSYASFTKDNPDPLIQLRAQFWYGRATKAGYDLLKHVPTKPKKPKTTPQPLEFQ